MSYNGNVKRTPTFLGLGFILLIIIFLVLRFRFQLGMRFPLEPGVPVFVSLTSQQKDSLSGNSDLAVPYRIESVITDLNVPWSVVFTAEDRMLITERAGTVRVVEKNILLPEPIRIFPEVSSAAEEGLMGMTLDPDYDTNKYVYLCLAYEKGNETFDKVIRVTDRNGVLDEDFTIQDNIPAAMFHAGCRLRFGPDEKLYISTGDAQNKSIPQDLDSLGGKILRLNADGTIPADNPYDDSPVFSYGHRNPQGFDWHPVSGTFVATEHGPSGSDGPGGGDEVNIIKEGENYGWPVVSHQQNSPGMVSPLLVFTPAIAPASGMFYRGSVFPQFTNTFLFGLLRGEGIMQVVFDSNDPEKVVSYQKLSNIDVGRVRDVVEGPDGLIYFTTSNTDGRGRPRAGDDQIYRLIPEK